MKSNEHYHCSRKCGRVGYEMCVKMMGKWVHMIFYINIQYQLKLVRIKTILMKTYQVHSCLLENVKV